MEVIIGSVGVGLLLIAFTLNLFSILKFDSKIYVLLNFLGAYLSCYASVLINYLPFVILEGTWAMVAFTRLVILLKREIKT